MTLFLIGNGFDLNCGMNTRFSDVYMREYLGREQKLFFKRMNDEAKEKIIHDEMVDSFSGFYKGISHNVNSTMSIRDAGLRRNIQAISFNYTEVFDYAMEKAFDQYSYRAPQIIHIHGKLGDDPTLGIDNENQWKAAYPLSRNGKRAFVNENIIKPVTDEEYSSSRYSIRF